MTWQAPGWLELVILSLAAFRVWRLIGEDVILDRPREWLIGRYPWFEKWITCPWCAGTWVYGGVWLAWIASPDWTLIVSGLLAGAAIVGLVAANLDPD